MDRISSVGLSKPDVVSYIKRTLYPEHALAYGQARMYGIWIVCPNIIEQQKGWTLTEKDRKKIFWLGLQNLKLSTVISILISQTKSLFETRVNCAVKLLERQEIYDNYMKGRLSKKDAAKAYFNLRVPEQLILTDIKDEYNVIKQKHKELCLLLAKEWLQKGAKLGSSHFNEWLSDNDIRENEFVDALNQIDRNTIINIVVFNVLALATIICILIGFNSFAVKG